MQNVNKIKTVTNGKWGSSVTTGTNIEGCILNVYKQTRLGRFQYGDANGMKFATSEEAWQYAFEHGYTTQYVKVWCRKCRELHRSIGGMKTSFCFKHSEMAS